MKYLSVCSGIEAASVAWYQLGFIPVAFSEIESFPRAVLQHHYPQVPNLGDMTKFKDWPDYAIDILVGGTPCQSFSVAGLRKGLADPRGNLCLTFLAIIERYRPRWVVWENVPGVHSSWSDEAVRAETEATGEMESRVRRLALEAGLNGETIGECGGFVEADQSNDFDCFLAGLEELGYGVASTVLDAQFFGVAQRRERVFVVGHIGGQWQRAAAVLFERACLCWDNPPSRETGQRVAATVSASTPSRRNGGSDPTEGHFAIAPTIPSRERGGGGLGTDFDCDGGVIPIQEIGKRESGTPMNGVGHGAPGDPMFTLQKSAVHGVCAFDTTQITSKANRSNPQPGDPCHPLAEGAHAPAIAFSAKDSGGDATTELSPTMRAHNHDKSHANSGWSIAVAHTLKADGFDASEDGTGRGTPLVPTAMAVRRLTPRECERLQGFPDDYTLIPTGKKPASECPDGPRYKALGNSMAVPCMVWIGKRILEVEAIP